MRLVWFPVLSLWACVALAAPLDEAIALVVRVSPEIRQRQIEADAVSGQTDWTSRVRFGYAQKGTQTEADGMNASLQFEIPLFSRKRAIDAAKVRSQLAQTRAATVTDFLAEVRSLVSLDGEELSTQELSELAADRLLYFRQSVEQGIDDADVLWPQAEAAKKAEQASTIAQADYRTALETTARRFGAEQWKQLQDLLAEHVKQSRP